MPRMTYADFARTVETIYKQAQDNLVADGAVHPAVLALNAKGERVAQVLATGPTPTEEDLAQAARSGIALVPHPLRDHAEAIRVLFADAGAVAAIVIAESWAINNARDAQDAIANNIPASEHPNRVEIVAVHGVWPREYFDQMHLALIDRDENGRPTPLPYSTLGVDPDDLGAYFSMGWINDTLPQPGRSLRRNAHLN